MNLLDMYGCIRYMKRHSSIPFQYAIDELSLAPLIITGNWNKNLTSSIKF
jgi:hypothetical protein